MFIRSNNNSNREPFKSGFKFYALLKTNWNAVLQINEVLRISLSHLPSGFSDFITVHNVCNLSVKWQLFLFHSVLFCVFYSPAGFPLPVVQKMQEICELSSETTSNLSICLSLFSRQEGVSVPDRLCVDSGVGFVSSADEKQRFSLYKPWQVFIYLNWFTKGNHYLLISGHFQLWHKQIVFPVTLKTFLVLWRQGAPVQRRMMHLFCDLYELTL